MNFSSPRDGISAQFLGLTKALLEHLFALLSLAALETKELTIKILPSLLLLVLIFCALLFAYLFSLIALIALAILKYHLSWLVILSSAALFHVGVAILLILWLRHNVSYSPFPITRLEIQRDVEALKEFEFPI